MLMDKLKGLRVVLGSQSPRRRDLLAKMDVDFEVVVKDAPEHYDPSDDPEKIVLGIALNKLAAFDLPEFAEALVIVADTIVVHRGNILMKPTDEADAFRMLRALQNDKHDVLTAVAFSHSGKTRRFVERTTVEFGPLSDAEIRSYIRSYQPYDKAGAYGIQEWLGFVAARRITGSYENVMGLPTARLYQELKGALMDN